MAQASVKCGRRAPAGKHYKFVFPHELFGTMPSTDLCGLVGADDDHGLSATQLNECLERVKGEIRFRQRTLQP